MRTISTSAVLSCIAATALGASMAFSPQKAPQKASAYEPEGAVYAVICSQADSDSPDDAMYASINVSDGKVTPVWKSAVFTNGQDNEVQTAALHDGIVYIPKFDQNMVTQEFQIIWKRVNIVSGQQLPDLNFNQDFNAYCYSLTFDDSRGKFYGLSMDMQTGAFSQLVEIEIDKDSHSTKLLGNVGSSMSDCMTSIAYCPLDESLYGISSDGNMYMIMPERAQAIPVKEFDQDTEYAAIPNPMMTQPLVYSPKNHSFITLYKDSESRTSRLVFIDCLGGNFDVQEGEDLQGGYFVTALLSDEQYAEDDAPAIPVIDEIVFDGPELSGNITFTAPTTNFNGDEISSTMTATVSVDGEVYAENEIEPGKQMTLPLSLSEGEHSVEVSCTLDDLTGPVASRTIYTGYDAPIPPFQIALLEKTLFWMPVEPVGIHDGYVNPQNIKYKVYMDGVCITPEPIDANTLEITPPESPRRVSFQVSSIADGKESPLSMVVSEVFGNPFPLPVSFAPSKEDMELFTCLDANADGNNFVFYEKNGVSYIANRTEQYYQSPDDWFFLPQMAFDDPAALYSISFLHSHFFDSDKHVSDLEIMIGKGPNPESMTATIFAQADIAHNEDTMMTVNFTVPEAGEYIIGIHSMSKNQKGSYRGDKFSNISVGKAGETIVGMPSDPTEISFSAAPLGELSLNIKATIPVSDLAGEPLDKDAVITLEAVCGANSAKASGKPGEIVEFNLPVDTNGFVNVNVTPSSGDLRGIVRTHTAYVGLDTPVAPSNLRMEEADDNMSATITWDAPTQGVNGGYVDPEGLTYNIFTQSSISASVIANTDKTSYVYRPAAGAQGSYYLGASAVNEIGQSMNNAIVNEFIGKPYDLPMVENFASMKFDCSPWANNTSGEFANCLWSSVGNMDGLGIGDPEFNLGGFVCQNTAPVPAMGELKAPKFSTKNLDHALFSLRYWNYAAAASMELWARSNRSRELHKIAEITPSRPIAGAWENWEVLLPEELLDCQWVQINIRAIFGTGTAERAVIDRYSVTQDVDHDFKVASLSVPELSRVGEDSKVSASVINSGNEPNTGSLTIELLGDGNVLFSQSVETGRLIKEQSFSNTFLIPVKVEYLNYDKLEIRASSFTENDMIETNNVLTASLAATTGFLPAVTDLKGSIDNGNVQLSWSDPDLSYGGNEAFELYPSFLNEEMIGPWKNIDRDGKIPFVIEGLRWSGDDAPSAWTLFNAQEKNAMDHERIAPHSGTSYLIARSIGYNEGEEPIQNNDWLISPEVVGGTTVSFWMNTFNTTYTETIEAWYSPSDDNPDSFIRIRPFTKSGSEAWEQIEFKLPENAKYFALVYRSWGQFAAMIDDIEYTPAHLSTHELYGFDVVRTLEGQDPEVIAEFVKENSFTDSEFSGDKATYHVVPKILTDLGMMDAPRSNEVFISLSGIDRIPAGASVAGGIGEIIVNGLEGNFIAVYSADGKYLFGDNAASDAVSIKAAPGIYAVKVGKAVAKVIVR